METSPSGVSDASAPRRTERPCGAIVLAALALPGVYAAPAFADSAPDQGVIELKTMHYQESQPGLQRIRVNSPSLYVLAPVGSKWAVEASAVVDSISGATPRWQSSISSASVMHETRVAEDLKITRYFDRSSYALGIAHSGEHDYKSDTASLAGSWSSNDNNRTWSAAFAGTFDRIDPKNGGLLDVTNEHRRTGELQLGITQALSVNDLIQANFTGSSAYGYLSDPYKTLDERPRQRASIAALARWNHHFNNEGSTLRSSYRYYHDSYGINAHTVELEWVKPIGQSVTVAPLMRYYTQSSARFYLDAQYDPAGAPIFPNLQPGEYNTGDPRLSAFGAVSVGLKLDYRINDLWSIDGKVEGYEQRTAWRLGGPGSVGVDPLRAYFVVLGAARKF